MEVIRSTIRIILCVFVLMLGNVWSISELISKSDPLSARNIYSSQETISDRSLDIKLPSYNEESVKNHKSNLWRFYTDALSTMKTLKSLTSHSNTTEQRVYGRKKWNGGRRRIWRARKTKNTPSNGSDLIMERDHALPGYNSFPKDKLSQYQDITRFDGTNSRIHEHFNKMNKAVNEKIEINKGTNGDKVDDEIQPGNIKPTKLFSTYDNIITSTESSIRTTEGSNINNRINTEYSHPMNKNVDRIDNDLLLPEETVTVTRNTKTSEVIPAPSGLISHELEEIFGTNTQGNLHQQNFLGEKSDLQYDNIEIHSKNDSLLSQGHQDNKWAEQVSNLIFLANHRPGLVTGDRYDSSNNKDNFDQFEASYSNNANNLFENQINSEIFVDRDDNYDQSATLSLEPAAQSSQGDLGPTSSIYYYYYPVTEEEIDQAPAAEQQTSDNSYSGAADKTTAEVTTDLDFGEDESLLEIHQVITAVAIPLIFVAGALGLLVLVTTLASPNFSLGRQDHSGGSSGTISNPSNLVDWVSVLSNVESSGLLLQVLELGRDWLAQSNDEYFESLGRLVMSKKSHCGWSPFCIVKEVSTSTPYSRVISLFKNILEGLTTLPLHEWPSLSKLISPGIV